MARRSCRGGRTPTTGGGGYDHGGYDSSDNDNGRSCPSPPGAQLEHYKEHAYAAGEPDDGDYKTPLPESGRHPLTRCEGVQTISLSWEFMRTRSVHY